MLAARRCRRRGEDDSRHATAVNARADRARLCKGGPPSWDEATGRCVKAAERQTSFLGAKPNRNLPNYEESQLIDESIGIAFARDGNLASSLHSPRRFSFAQDDSPCRRRARPCRDARQLLDRRRRRRERDEALRRRARRNRGRRRLRGIDRAAAVALVQTAGGVVQNDLSNQIGVLMVESSNVLFAQALSSSRLVAEVGQDWRWQAFPSYQQALASGRAHRLRPREVSARRAGADRRSARAAPVGHGPDRHAGGA